MSEKLEPFLKTRNTDDLCLICGEELVKDISVISQDLNAWEKLKDHARAWKDVPLKPGEEFYEFTLVHEKVDGVEIPFGKRHRSFKCKGNFAKTALREKLKIARAAEPPIEEADTTTNVHDDTDIAVRRTRSSTGNTVQFARICFICNEVRTCDNKKYREGGLGKCEFVTAAEKLEKAARLIAENHRYYNAKLRFELLISGESKDIYSAIDHATQIL